MNSRSLIGKLEMGNWKLPISNYKFLINTCLLAGAILILVSCSSVPKPGREKLPPEIQTIFQEKGAWLGINVKDDKPKGAEIVEIYIGSPAETAGLKVNDVVVEFDGKEVKDTKELLSLINLKKSNDQVKLQVIRNEDTVSISSAVLSPTEISKASADELAEKYNEFLTKANPSDKISFTAFKKAVIKEFEVTLATQPRICRIVTPPKPEIRGKKPAGFMGIGMEPAKDLDKLGQPKDTFGMKINSVTPFSAADKAGLKSNDIILSYDGITFPNNDESNMGKFSDYIKDKGSGADIRLTIMRRVNEVDLLINNSAVQTDSDKLMETINKIKVGSKAQANVTNNVQRLDLKIILGTRMTSAAVKQTEPEPNDKIHPELANYTTPIEQLTMKIINDTKIKDNYDDLLKRYADDEKWDDGFRLKDIRYMHRDPFKIPKVCDGLLANLRQSFQKKDSSFLDIAIAELDQAITDEPVALVPLKTGLSLEEHGEQLANLLQQAEKYRKEAFAGLTQSDIDFLQANLIGLTERWVRDSNFSDPDEVKNRNSIDKKTIELCGYVNFQKLFASAKILCSILAPDYLNGLKADIEKAAGDKQGVLFSKDTPLGKIIIGGKGNDQYLSPAAIIIDIGGDNFYANNAGGSIPGKQPFSIIIDYGGNNRFYSYNNGCQGCGIMGVGILVNLGKGSNTYVAQNWAQGSGLLGVGILINESGKNNTYKGQEFVQGCGLFGIGILIDRYQSPARTAVQAGGQPVISLDGLPLGTSGTDWDDLYASDYYEANGFAQGFAGPEAVGILYDTHGHNAFRASGKYPNGYPENVGTFDGWAQGCGTGFRAYADWSMSRSGGLGILLDDNGGNYYEAGTFSQGGGYFFGWGILSNAGDGKNKYVGTRYSQGFAAHSAIGYFIDEGGHNDFTTLCGVTSGLSWDLTGVVFINQGGNNTYDAGGFSLGAAAHNGFCLFENFGGKNTYKGGVARATSNNYHGGSSLSVFLSQGEEENTYTDTRPNNAIEVDKEYSIFIDTKKPVAELLKDDFYKTMLKNNIEPVTPTKQTSLKPKSDSSAVKVAGKDHPSPEPIVQTPETSKGKTQNSISEKPAISIADNNPNGTNIAGNPQGYPVGNPKTLPPPITANLPPSAISFATSVNPDNSPISPTNVFEAGTKRIYACFENKGLLAGLSEVGTNWISDAEDEVEFAEVKPIDPNAKFNYIWVEKDKGWSKCECEVTLINRTTMQTIGKGKFTVAP